MEIADLEHDVPSLLGFPSQTSIVNKASDPDTEKSQQQMVH